MKKKSFAFFPWRFFLLGSIFVLFFVLVLTKLFFLQIVHGEEVRKMAAEKRSSSIEIKARRGNIFAQDSKTGETSPLAINTTLFKIFVDASPNVSPDLSVVAKTLTDILYTSEEFKKCLENFKQCPEGSVEEIFASDSSVALEEEKEEKKEKKLLKRILPSYTKAKQQFHDTIVQKISEKVEYIVFATDVSDEQFAQLEQKNFSGMKWEKEKKEVHIDLRMINANEKKPMAEHLALVFGGKAKNVEKKLEIRLKSYVPIIARVGPDAVEQLKKLKEESRKKYLKSWVQHNKEKRIGSQTLTTIEPDIFAGIGIEPESLRYYPEGNLASVLVGFLNAEKTPQYGVEEKMDYLLSGENGKYAAQKDIHGNAVNVNRNNSGRVKDGSDVVLTIDRMIQQQVENILNEAVERYRADSGQIVVMNPQNGDILAMASSPGYDPNFYGEIYKRKKIEAADLPFIYKTTPIEKKDEQGNFVGIKYKEFLELWGKKDAPELYWFENRVGSGSYIDRNVAMPYEPGSVIKTLMMAYAMEIGEITKETRYFESEPIKVGPYTIQNSDKKYLGSQTMTNILERSANLGMIFITNKLDKPLSYKALQSFGFGEYTNIDLADEIPGKLDHYKSWSDAQLFNAGFGQGFSATTLQVARAWAVLANGGYLVKPRIISEIRHANGEVEKIPEERKKVLSHKTTNDITQMSISAVENGVAKNARVAGHYIAGKTGTSQISKVDGAGYEDLNQDGNTITSFVGYAPVENPQFVVLVKFDRPRIGAVTFGSTTASPTFVKVAEFLFDYYNIPDDKARKK